MSYIGVDLDNHVILFKTYDMQSACLLSALDFEDQTHLIFPVERLTGAESQKPRISRFPDFITIHDQKKVYRNMTGSEPPATVGDLGKELHQLLLDLPMTTETPLEIAKRAGPNPLAADIGMPDGRANKGYQQPSIPLAPSHSALPAIPMAPKIPMAPSIPKAPSAIPSAPKAGGTTARVWEIATEILGRSQIDPPNLKELRQLVVGACQAEGINPGTAATQFGAWKRSKGL